jgi:formylglycine-generating enzyme required for sulfatase activity
MTVIPWWQGSRRARAHAASPCAARASEQAFAPEASAFWNGQTRETAGLTVSLDKQAEPDCYIAREGVAQAETKFEDGGCVTMPVGNYKPHALGLYDMHGNACEWTLTDGASAKLGPVFSLAATSANVGYSTGT